MLWFRKQDGGSLIGDLDVMSRRPVYVRYKGKEYLVRDLTARDYARLCAILKEIEDKTSSGDIEATDRAYYDLLRMALPTMWTWTIKRMALVDANALVIWILKHYGIDLEKKNPPEPPKGKKKKTS